MSPLDISTSGAIVTVIEPKIASHLYHAGSAVLHVTVIHIRLCRMKLRITERRRRVKLDTAGSLFMSASGVGLRLRWPRRPRCFDSRGTLSQLLSRQVDVDRDRYIAYGRLDAVELMSCVEIPVGSRLSRPSHAGATRRLA
jgi:hypothetical protein